MKIKEVAEALERFAPLPLQESYDNAGLQIGLTEADNLTGVLLCLDVTEDVIREAAQKGCNLIVSHHPLIFRGLKCIADETIVQRCVRLALKENVAIYSAHTNLDNVEGGVNWKIAEHLGLTKTRPLVPGTPLSEGWQTGSGLIGELPKSVEAYEFLAMVKSEFKVEKLSANRVPRGRMIRRVALCGGAGDFLLDEVLRQGADAFLTGEMHYHQYFGLEDRILIGVLGHYESEQYTIQLLKEILEVDVDDVPIYETQYNTNPIQYL